MTTVFAVNDNRDIFANSNGRLALLQDLQAVLQYAAHVVRARRGEMVYAATRGIDFIDNAFAGAPNLLQFEAQVRAAITRIPEVRSVTDFEADVTGNVLQYSADIQTIFGSGSINGTV